MVAPGCSPPARARGRPSQPGNLDKKIGCQTQILFHCVIPSMAASRAQCVLPRPCASVPGCQSTPAAELVRSRLRPVWAEHCTTAAALTTPPPSLVTWPMETQNLQCQLSLTEFRCPFSIVSKKCYLNVKALVGAYNQEQALVVAFSV